MSEDEVGDRRARIEQELLRIEESAMWSAQAQFEQAKQWRGVTYCWVCPRASLRRSQARRL